MAKQTMGFSSQGINCRADQKLYHLQVCIVLINYELWIISISFSCIYIIFLVLVIADASNPNCAHCYLWKIQDRWLTIRDKCNCGSAGLYRASVLLNMLNVFFYSWLFIWFNMISRYDMEDAMVLNRSSVDRGFAHGHIYQVLTISIYTIKKIKEKND